MTLRGIFMMRQSEMEHFLHGMRVIFPEAWDKFVEPLTALEREDILISYYRRLTDPDPKIHMPAAERWSSYESACLRLIPEEKAETPAIPHTKEYEAFAYAIARLECHYFVHNRFDPDHYLLANVHKIRHIPCVIVQGRYDIICPPVSAYELHQRWPEAEFIIVPDAGHAASEPGVTSALVRATNNFRSVKS
jgi:proline iminopeptidase